MVMSLYCPTQKSGRVKMTKYSLRHPSPPNDQLEYILELPDHPENDHESCYHSQGTGMVPKDSKKGIICPVSMAKSQPTHVKSLIPVFYETPCIYYNKKLKVQGFQSAQKCSDTLAMSRGNLAKSEV